MCRYLFFSLLILFSLGSCKNKESELADCSQVRSGRFEYRSPIADGTIAIERNDSIQTESESTTGVTMNFKINWVSPCEYTLKFLSFADQTMAEMLPADSMSMSKSKVIKITSNYYIAETIIMGQGGVQRDTILIIR